MNTLLRSTVFLLFLIIIILKNVKSAEEPEAVIDRNKVALDIPSELLGSSASITLKLSGYIGQLIEVHTSLYRHDYILYCDNMYLQNSVRRKARMLQILNPLFGNALDIKIPPKTTTEANRK